MKNGKLFIIVFVVVGAILLFAVPVTKADTCETVSCPPGSACVPYEDGSVACVPVGPGPGVVPGGPGPGIIPSTCGSAGGEFSLPNPLGVCSVSELFVKIANFLMTLAIPFAVFMVILAGFRFATAQGNEEKLSKARQNFIWTVVGVAIILASEVLIIYIEELLGARGGDTVGAFIDRIKQVLNIVIGLLFALVTILFGWGVIEYVVGAYGDEEKLKQGKRHMVWGISGMAIMAAAWGIVELISNFVK